MEQFYYKMIKKLLFFLLIFLGCTNHKEEVNNFSTPPSSTLSEMLGICAGPNVDGFSKSKSLPTFIQNFRYFYLQEHDFTSRGLPRNFSPSPCALPCDNYDCWSAPKSSFAGNKYRLCRLKTHFKKIHVAWEAINVNGKTRHWPDKWFTDKEWGTNYEERVENSKIYTLAFLKTICPEETCIIDVLEVGNEPWGVECPGLETYHAIQEGIILAFRSFFNSEKPEDWPIKLSTGAFQAKRSRPNLLDDIESMIPEHLRQYYDFISLHAYARGPNGSMNTNLIDGGEKSFFNRLKTMEAWRSKHMPGAKVNLTEFGWNASSTKGVGTSKQINYLIQALLVAQRFGIHRAFIYELEDQPKVTLFNSMGLFENGNHKPKPLYFALKEFLENYGDLQFVKILQETDNEFEYGFGKQDSVTHIFQGNFQTGEVFVDNQSLNLRP